MSLEGIDVSRWQTRTPALLGLSFLFARATIGTERDTRYRQHITNAQAAGLVTGGYHFNHNTIKVEDQVAAFLDAARGANLLALDVEGAHAFTLSQTRRFIAGVHAAGRTIGLYMSQSGFYRDAGQNWNWVAKWSPTPPTIPYTFWQYRGSPLDLDRFAGSRADLDKLAGIPLAPDSSVEETMIVPQQLAHVITTRDAHVYSGPDHALKLPSALSKGTRLRKFGGVTGWQFVQLNYGGIEQYAWLKSDDVASDPQPLTVIDGAPDCKAAIAADRAKAFVGYR